MNEKRKVDSKTLADLYFGYNEVSKKIQELENKLNELEDERIKIASTLEQEFGIYLQHPGKKKTDAEIAREAWEKLKQPWPPKQWPYEYPYPHKHPHGTWCKQ